MKIMVISNYRSQHTARPEAEIFVSLAQRGYDITIVTYPDADYIPRFEAAGCKIIGWHPIKRHNRSEIKKIRELILEHNITHLHLYNSVSSVNGIAAAKGLPVKVLLYRGYAGNIHWLDPLSYRKYLHPRVDGIQCNSSGVQQLVQKHLWRNKEKAVTISKGHSLDWYSSVEAHNIRQELGISDDQILLVNVANNRKMKGIPYLLQAMSYLVGQPVILLLIGREMDTVENLSFLRKANATQMVKFLGYRTDVLEIVKSCDVFVSSSIKGESITRSILEAMSLGVAQIVTDIPGNVELVEEGVSGLVAQMKNGAALSKAIKQLIDDRELLAQFKENAPKHIDKHLNHTTTVDKMEEWYRTLDKKKDLDKNI